MKMKTNKPVIVSALVVAVISALAGCGPKKADADAGKADSTSMFKTGGTGGGPAAAQPGK
jgi:hypothetical protein